MEKYDIDENLIKRLTSSYKTMTINDKIYKYLGKGGDGIIYTFNFDNPNKTDNLVMKIYIRKVDNTYITTPIVKEFYLLGLLRELDVVNRNIIHIYDYSLSMSRPIVLMELMDGDLGTWAQMMLSNNDPDIKSLTQDKYDSLWMSMIFQVVYGFTFLNNIGVLHNDSKPKNILYKKTDTEYETYAINNKTYNVPFTYNFKISDFGAIQILNSTTNQMSDDEIKSKINSRQDLYELSRIIYRFIVNYALTDYSWDNINKLMILNNKLKIYHDEQKKLLYQNLKKYPEYVKKNMLLRSIIYYSVENNLIKFDDIVSKHNLRLPSKYISDILNKLTDSSINNMSKLFELFFLFMV